jgi:hypothetical protein
MLNMNPTPWVATTLTDVTDRAGRWLTNDVLDQLIRQLGGPPPAIENLAELCAWSTSVLDRRRGAERREAQPLDLPPDSLDALLQVADPLGLVRTAPPIRSHYDAVIVLGGATTGNRLRTELVRDVLGTVETDLLVALASDRRISRSELIDEPDSAADGTEWQNLLRYFDQRFDLVTSEHGTPGTQSHDQAYRTNGGTPLRVLIAPRHEARRPTTMQQIAFLRERIPETNRHSILLVTSAIYAPYQFFAAAPAVLVDGADHAELIGTETSMTGDPQRLAQRIGQEIHAAIEAATRLVESPRT